MSACLSYQLWISYLGYVPKLAHETAMLYSEHDLVEIICRVVTEMPNMRDKWEIRGSCCLWKGARQLKRIRGEGGSGEGHF